MYISKKSSNLKRFYNIQIMEDLKRNTATDVDKEIVFSKAIKAGKRIYYLDVKKNRKGERDIQTNRRRTRHYHNTMTTATIIYQRRQTRTSTSHHN